MHANPGPNLTIAPNGCRVATSWVRGRRGPTCGASPLPGGICGRATGRSRGARLRTERRVHAGCDVRSAPRSRFRTRDRHCGLRHRVRRQSRPNRQPGMPGPRPPRRASHRRIARRRHCRAAACGLLDSGWRSSGPRCDQARDWLRRGSRHNYFCNLFRAPHQRGPSAGAASAADHPRLFAHRRRGTGDPRCVSESSRRRCSRLRLVLERRHHAHRESWIRDQDPIRLRLALRRLRLLQSRDRRGV